MAGGKETPRQKMIGMMYLVLTALLALNVSVEILDAFNTVNEGVEQTNTSLTKKVNDLYKDFKYQYDNQTEKVGDKYLSALEVRKEASELVEYIEKLKIKLIRRTEGLSEEEVIKNYYTIKTEPDPLDPGKTIEVREINLNKIGGRDKYDEATNVLIGFNNNGDAYELSKKMTKFRNLVLDKLEIKDKDSDIIGLKTQQKYKAADGSIQNWEYHNFYHVILVGDITILNKIINEVRTAEFDAVNALMIGINKSDFKFGNLQAKIIPQSTYVLQGGKFNAEILVAGYDESSNPTVNLKAGGSTRTIEGTAGKVNISLDASRVGVQEYSGKINIRDPKDPSKTVPFKFNGSFTVAPPSLTVAATKMNVFYIGVDNPVSISVPGVSQNDIHPSISGGGTLRKLSNGTYVVRVNGSSKKAIISATANINGKEQSMGRATFRVKRVPDPVAKIGGQTEGKIIKNKLLAARSIIPSMPDFDFELFFKVKSFNMGTIVNGDFVTKKSRNNTFTPEMIDLIKKARSGQKFFFENIVAVGPDKKPRNLASINLELQ